MDKQLILDKVVDAYITRGEGLGYDKEREICLYVTPEGNRCGIGQQFSFERATEIQLLSDTKSDQNEWGGTGVMEILSHIDGLAEELGVSPTDTRDIRFLVDLQAVHDSVARGHRYDPERNKPQRVGTIGEELRLFAGLHNLIYKGDN